MYDGNVRIFNFSKLRSMIRYGKFLSLDTRVLRIVHK